MAPQKKSYAILYEYLKTASRFTHVTPDFCHYFFTILDHLSIVNLPDVDYPSERTIKTWCKKLKTPRILKQSRILDLFIQHPEVLEDEWLYSIGSKYRSYQNRAIKSWFENDKKGIMSLPTGSGKSGICKGIALDLDMQLKEELVDPYIIYEPRQYQRLNNILHDKPISKTKAQFKGLLVIISSDNYNSILHWKITMGFSNPIMYYSNNTNRNREIRKLIKDLPNPKTKEKLGCILTSVDTMKEEEFLNEIRKNFNTLLIVDGIDDFDTNDVSTEKLQFIDYRLGSIHSGYDLDQINNSTKEYFNGICFELSVNDLII